MENDRNLPAKKADRLHPIDSSPGRTLSLLMVLGLLGVVFLVYGQAAGFNFITFDDGEYVTDNWSLQQGLTPDTFRWAFTTFASANWHPLTWLSLLLDFQLYGLNAGGYHLTNVLIHAGVTVGIFLWLRSATGAFWRPAFVAGLMALHPMHVESVAWVAERKDMLSALFFVATLAAYTRWTRRGGAGNYVLTLGLFALGLMAKPMLVTLPAVLLLLDGWPLGRLGANPGWRAWGRRVWEKAPFFVLSAASCVVTFVAQRAGGAVVPLQKLSPAHRLTNAVLGYGDYLRLTLSPRHLSIFYPRQESSSGWEVAGVVLVLAMVTTAAWRWRRAAPAVLMGWCWFVGMLVPVIGLVQVGGQAIADRYTYLPHLGLFVGFAWGVGTLAARWEIGRPGRLALAGATMAVLLAAGGRARAQASVWRSSFSLYQSSLETTGPIPRVCQLLADAALEDRHYQEADRWLQRALAGEPNEVHTLMQLGTVRLLQGRWREAAELLGPTLPHAAGNAANFNNFGLAMRRCGGHDDVAARAFERSLHLQPANAYAHYNLAEIRREQGAWVEATRHYEAALRGRPNWPDALLSLAFLRASCADPAVHDPGRALELASQAANLLGGHRRAGLDALAAAYAALDRWPEAVSAAEDALAMAEAEAGGDSALVRERRDWLAGYRAGRAQRL